MKSFSPVRLNPWRDLAILMIILMEVSWITPWFRSLTPETYAVDSLRVLIMLSCVVLFSHLLIRVMDYLRLKRSIRPGLMVAFLIVGSFVGIKTMLYAQESISLSELITRPIRSFADIKYLIPAEFIVTIAVLLGFWRGVSLAQEHVGPSSVKSHFLIGIVMFVVFIFVNTLVTGEQPGDFFYLFLFSSLVGMCAARMTIVGMVRGGKENRFNRSWFLGIILAAFLVVSLSAVLGGVITDQFAWIGVLFLGLFGSIIVLVWMISDPIISFLITILGKLTQNSQTIEDFGESINKLNKLMREFGQRIMEMVGINGIGSWLSRWGPTIKTIVLVSIIGLVILGIILWMAITLWRDRKRRLVEDEEKSNLISGNLIHSFLNLLHQGWNRALTSLDQLTDFRQRQRIRAAARIRQVYAELMELCASLGQPRPESHTPLEFVPKLERLFPEFHPEIGMITHAYLDVRYGQLPETQDEVAAIDFAWKKLHKAGDELLKETKPIKKNKAYG
ncbi:MAG: hypothetical protein A2Y53_02580 [Chloroflexi bacterium RBG_16_47_49]|nr:MAG: hypothetical protein A2Y53_02580 [Chloroflexi bacterium RBG_16_47_49]